MVTTLIDLTGQKFGRLTVIRRSGTIHGQASWLCKCECGNEKIVRGYCLRNSETKSCGCLAAELASSRLKTHGKTKTRLFKIWSGMKERCYREYHKSYPQYGGRGIGICEEWRDDFSKFYEWAINNGYSDNLTIDRIDVDGDYEPSNCRWATAKEQGNNRSTNRLIAIDGRTQTLAEWALEYNIIPETIGRRLKRGMDAKSAVTMPLNQSTRRKSNW